MRHRKSGRKLNRNSPQRKALKKSLAISIIEHESVKTTLAKAKEIRGFLEPLVTLAKENTVANQRLAFARLQSKAAVAKLFDELGPRYKKRPGERYASALTTMNLSNKVHKKFGKINLKNYIENFISRSKR